MLELLAGEADAAIGIDRSSEMLRVARAKLSSTGRAEVEVRQADMRALPFADAGFDTVTMHHVLHFTEEPALAVAEAARMVAPGGKLLVADYAPHDREELRRDHGHTRLGFEDSAIAGWMQSAGLRPEIRGRHPGPQLEVVVWEGRRCS
jgi:ArsR family transcriptional regulator